MRTPEDTAAAPSPRKRRRPLRWIGWLLLALLLLLVLALTGFTLWARTDGSLATALRLAGQHLPLRADNASGALLGSGKIDKLVWDKDGLRVEVDKAVLDWQPGQLLRRRLHVAQLSADRIVVDNQAPPKDKESASAGLPNSLALPFGLRVDVDEVRAGEILLQGPPDRRLTDIHATYHYDGNAHALQLLSARYTDDAYSATVQAQASAGAKGPMPVSAQISGGASALLPGAEDPALAALQVNVSGTLDDMQAQLLVQGTPDASSHELQLPPLPAADSSLQTAEPLAWPAAGDAAPLRLDASARITPNDSLPLQEAYAELHALDLSAFVADAPRTDLSAQINATPVAADKAGGGMGLALRAKIINNQAGPWDNQQLPVDRITADASWQDGVASVQRLLLELAGGSVETTGQWRSADAADAGSASQWQVQSQILHINPALLHGQLAAFPVDGTIEAQGEDANADFDVALDAADNPAGIQPPSDAEADADTEEDPDAAETAASDSEALAEQLRALALRQLRATGRFADQVLTLQQLLVQTDDAQLDGQATVDLADPEQLTVDSEIALRAPGLQLQAETAQLAADSGGGKAALELSDATATLQWVQKLPGAAEALAGAQASGHGTLDAHLDGGWLQPTLEARLDVPQLDVTPPAQDGPADPIQVRNLDTTVSGTLEQATLALRGRVLQPGQGVDMQLALDTVGGWADQVLTLDKLQLKAGEASAAGSAKVDLSDAFDAVADLKVNAPGLAATVKGNLAPESGDGNLQLNLSDAAATLRWARTLPGAASALAGASASGTAKLDARWQGGLDNPRLDASLGIPQLDYVAPDATDSLSVRNLQARLAGDMAQANLTANGHVVQGERRVDLKLAADGGRAGNQQEIWRLRLSELAAQLQLPELGDGQWQVVSRNQVPITWNPANGGQLDVAAGELTITSPEPRQQSHIIWEPVRLRDGQLHSAGRITELPMAWAERIAGEQMQDAGISGDVVFGGQWDIQMGNALKFNALLERKSGDIQLNAGGDSNHSSTVAAGLRQARVELSNSGNDIRADIVWDSERMGIINGHVGTRLTATRNAGGQTQWSWSDQAPVNGQIKADLPEISVWSLLAPPGWRLHGAVGADLQISGQAAQPQIAGTLTADDLAMRSVVDGLQFENGRLRAHAQGSRLIIDEFILHGAGEDGGSIRVTGEAGLLDGELAAQMHAVVDKLHASVREDRELIASGTVDAGFKNQTVRARGKLTVDSAHIILPDDSKPTLSDDIHVHGLNKDDQEAVEDAKAPAPDDDDDSAEQASLARSAAEASPLRADIDVTLDMGENFQVDGMGIDTRLAGSLALKANGPLSDMPTINGRVETVGGTFKAYGQHLNIERGRVFFSGEVTNPGLDILALRPNYTSDQEVGALIQGTALLPQVRLYSKPTLPDDQVLAWLILGHAAPEDGGEAAMMQSAALALLGGRESGGVASSLGLDELSFGGDTSDGLSGASVTLGKRLSDRLYTAYEHSLSGTGGVLLIFYELSKRWVVRGQASESSALDLIYNLSYD